MTEAHARGSISDEQMDIVAAVGQAMQNGHGYMVADDVGVGKSRELSGVAIDWIEKGKAKRILVSSKGEVNLRDLIGEMKVVAGVPPDGELPFKMVMLREFPESAERPNKSKEYKSPPTFSEPTIYLVEHFKFDDSRFKTIGLGKSPDVQQGGSVEILIYPPDKATGAARNQSRER